MAVFPSATQKEESTAHLVQLRLLGLILFKGVIFSFEHSVHTEGGEYFAFL